MDRTPIYFDGRSALLPSPAPLPFPPRSSLSLPPPPLPLPPPLSSRSTLLSGPEVGVISNTNLHACIYLFSSARRLCTRLINVFDSIRLAHGAQLLCQAKHTHMVLSAPGPFNFDVTVMTARAAKQRKGCPSIHFAQFMIFGGRGIAPRETPRPGLALSVAPRSIISVYQLLFT